jgi:uncharacterized protein GlcG (DUF336 family)
VDAAIALAKEANIAITVAVVDAGGHLMLLERMDGGKFHSVHSATTKAVCAASNKRSTAVIARRPACLGPALAAGRRWAGWLAASRSWPGSSASAGPPAAPGN